MNLNDYFNPISKIDKQNKKFVSGYFDLLSDKSNLHLKKYSIALFSAFSTIPNSQTAEIRNHFYQLSASFSKSFKAIDLGELKKGSTFSDILFATRDVCEFLLDKKIIPIIISDNSFLPYAVYLAYEALNHPVTITSLDYTIHCKLDDQHYIPQILSRKNNTLFNNNILGYQLFYTPQDEIKKAQSHFFNLVRLGDLQADIKKAETYLRDSDLFIIHSTSFLGSFLPTHKCTSPSGFLHKEVCQIARYAGISEKVSSLYLYADPLSNFNMASYAQILWHFIEGYAARVNDYPKIPFSKLIKYQVEISKGIYMTFYKSPISDRWWIEIPIPKSNFKKKWLLSCDVHDYHEACNGNIPERWQKAIKKFFDS